MVKCGSKIQPGLEFMDNWDFYLVDYDLHNGQHYHRHHHKNHHRSRNQSFSSTLLAAICKSTNVEGGMIAYKKSRSRAETRNFKVEYNIVMTNSRIERQWDNDPWLNDVKSMYGRFAEMDVFNADKYEAKAAYSKQGKFDLSNMPSALACSSDSVRNTSSISCLYLSSDVQSLYTHSSIRSAKQKGILIMWVVKTEHANGLLVENALEIYMENHWLELEICSSNLLELT
jgi:hypothetical protein